VSKISIAGKVKLNRADAAKAIYQQRNTQRAITQVGQGAAAAAQSRASGAVRASSNERGTMLNLPFQIRFKDVLPFYAPGAAKVVGTNAGQTIQVGLVVSDSSASQNLEFGLNGQPATGYMRGAAVEASSKPGVRFSPAGDKKKRRRRR
jgi:hypothetical protein